LLTNLINSERLLNISISLFPLGLERNIVEKARLHVDVNKLFGKKIIFINDERDAKSLAPLTSEALRAKTILFDAIEDSSVVGAVDSSTISIGETDEGTIYASKASAVFSRSRRISECLVVGPIMVYVSEDALENCLLNRRDKALQVLLDRESAKRMIRTRLELAVADFLIRELSSGIVLIDGPLRSSVFEDGFLSVQSLLKTASENGNVVIGFSKTSRIKTILRACSFLEQLMESQIALDISSLADPFLRSCLKRVYVVKFQRAGFAFRVDLPLFSDGACEKIFGRILGNVNFKSGYPEPLILAHHLSLFTRVEKLAFESALRKIANLDVVGSDDVRRAVLGSGFWAVR